MNNIGKVIFVSYEKLVFEVSDFEKLRYNYKGSVYSAKGILDYVTIIDQENQKYIYQVNNIFDKEETYIKDENSKMKYIGKFECFPIGVLKGSDINFNMKQYPFLQNKVYLTNKKDMEKIFQEKDNKNTLNIGKTKEDIPISIKMEKLFNYHTAILGNTGSGKSTTIREILKETEKYETDNLKIHILDVHNEYSNGNFETIKVSEEYKINIQELELQDWINLLKPSVQIQLPMLQTALRIANIIQNNEYDRTKLLKLYLAKTLYYSQQTDAVTKRTKVIKILENTEVDVEKYHSQFSNMSPEDEKEFIESIDKKIIEILKNKEIDIEKYILEEINNAEYKIDSFDKLNEGLEFAFLFEECKANNQVRGYCGTLETRIKNLKNRYGKLISENKTSKNKTSENKKIIVYSVDDLDKDLLLFFSSYLVKKEFEKNKNKGLDERIINIFILEEAHLYVSKENETSDLNELKIFEKIAREGRKFGCFLFLSSQRPSELSSTVLSQCNNYLLHRIKNNIDLDYINRTIPYIDKNQLTRLAYLPTGTSLLIGELFPFPVEIDVKFNKEKFSKSSETPSIKYGSVKGIENSHSK